MNPDQSLLVFPGLGSFLVPANQGQMAPVPAGSEPLVALGQGCPAEGPVLAAGHQKAGILEAAGWVTRPSSGIFSSP